MDSTFERALEHMSWTYRGMKKYDKALEYSKQYFRVSGSEESYILLSSLYEITGNPDSSEQVLRNAQQMFPQRKRNVLIEAGSASFNAGNSKRGEKLFRRALLLDPSGKDINIYNGLGWSLLRQQKNEEAKEYFLKGYALDSLHVAILNGLWNVCVSLKDYDSALGYLQSYVRLGSRFVSKTFLSEQMGRIQLLRGNYAEAERLLKKSIVLDSTKANIQRLLGYVFSVQGRFIDAKVFSEKSLSIDTTYPSYNLHAWILIAGNLDIDKGMALAHHALNLRPKEWQLSLSSFVPFSEHTLGLGYLKKGEYEKAVKYLEEAIRIEPGRKAVKTDLVLARKALKSKK